MDVQGDGTVDLVMFSDYGGDYPGVDIWEGEHGWTLGWGDADKGPMYVFDVDGDCQPELVSGRLALRGVDAGPPEMVAIRVSVRTYSEEDHPPASVMGLHQVRVTCGLDRA